MHIPSEEWRNFLNILKVEPNSECCNARFHDLPRIRSGLPPETILLSWNPNSNKCTICNSIIGETKRKLIIKLRKQRIIKQPTNTILSSCANLLLHCLVVLSLNLDAMIAQLHTKTTTKNSHQFDSTFNPTKTHAQNQMKEALLFSSMEANLLAENVILLQPNTTHVNKTKNPTENFSSKFITKAEDKESTCWLHVTMCRSFCLGGASVLPFFFICIILFPSLFLSPLSIKLAY